MTTGIIAAVVYIAIWLNNAATASNSASIGNNERLQSSQSITNTSNNANFTPAQTVSYTSGETADMRGERVEHAGGMDGGNDPPTKKQSKGTPYGFTPRITPTIPNQPNTITTPEVAPQEFANPGSPWLRPTLLTLLLLWPHDDPAPWSEMHHGMQPGGNVLREYLDPLEDPSNYRKTKPLHGNNKGNANPYYLYEIRAFDANRGASITVKYGIGQTSDGGKRMLQSEENAK
jgi:hypothetical protein